MAGVSIATVSHVLNDTAPVSAETREKVEEIIKKTGYCSNILAKGLRTNKTNLVGILVEDITVWHTALIIDGINKIAEENGYNTILCNLRLLSKIKSQFQYITNFQQDINKALDVLVGMQVDGIIYVGMHDRKISHVLRDIPQPIVYCYCYTDGKGSSVRYSNEETSYTITKKLINLGYRNLGVINGLSDSEPAVLRFKGFCRALEEKNIPLKPENVACGNWQYQDGFIAARGLLKKSDHPDAIVAMNDEMAVGVYDAARELGLRIPEDVSVTGFDNSSIIQHLTPRLVTANRPLHEMGYRSMQTLVDRISGKIKGDQNIILPCSLLDGDSVKKWRKS